ncbi:MAG: CoA transferase [Desulfuromonadaceae bacterium]|nr:CoA transferase [Desulfuromonadaceae bacterium]
MSGLLQALQGIKVVEFGGYAAGPHVGKLLANFGAEVVHVESRSRPDGFRLQYPPFREGKPAPDNGACFAIFNDSKYGVTLDLKSPAGLELALKLVQWCDIVVENMRPGVMERLGLGYAKLREVNESVIMLSSCNMGQTGPRANTPGFGSQLTALAGICGLTGKSGGPPMLLYGPYIDFIASTMGAASVLAAIEQRRTTGLGAWIDLSQYEAGLHFIAGALVDYSETGRIAERVGNADSEAAPHGCFVCRDSNWVALSCWSDDEFGRLTALVSNSVLTADKRFNNIEGRRGSADELEALIAEWTLTLDAEEIAQLLQANGVHAYPVNTIADLFEDPQLLYRRLWHRRRHPVIGEHNYQFPGFNLAITPGDVTAPAPCLGADNETVFRNLVGLTDEEYQHYQFCKAFD